MDGYEQLEITVESAIAADDGAIHDSLMDIAARWAIIAQAEQLKRIADALESLNRTLGNRTE